MLMLLRERVSLHWVSFPVEEQALFELAEVFRGLLAEWQLLLLCWSRLGTACSCKLLRTLHDLQAIEDILIFHWARLCPWL